jgi:hypothetical protein
MRKTTELGALTGVNSRLVGFDAVEVYTARHSITLAIKRWDPI